MTDKQKNIFFSSFQTFRSYAGNRIYALVFFILASGVFEGVGIGLFIPLLKFDASHNETTDVVTKNVYSFIAWLGVPLQLSSLLGLIFLVFLVKGLMLYLQVLAQRKITTDLTKELRKKIVTQFSCVDYSFFISKTTGYFNNLVSVEVDRAVNGLSKYCEIIGYLIYIVIYLFAATLLNPIMTVVIMGIGVILLGVFRFLHRRSAVYSMAISDENATMQSMLIQFLYNFKYLKATQSFKPLLDMLESSVCRLASKTFRLGALGGILPSLLEPIVILFMSGIIIFHVSYRGGSFPEIMVLLIFFHRTFTKVFGFQIAWQKFHSSLGGVTTVESAIDQLDNRREKRPDSRGSFAPGDITLDKVNFSFDDKQVLFDLCLKVKQNCSIAVVGESGAGKTTLFDIVAGLLVPQSGQIRLGEKNYSEISFQKLRSHIGYVTQEPVIFNDTIANNICFWQCSPNSSECMDKIKEAAKLAYCDQFIQEMPEGYKTIVGDKGVKLSGGQRQRISIAREIFKEADILIFDEATSALDTESERCIQKSLANLKGSRTMIIIAHRLSTIKDCDYVYVFSKGRIVEAGEYDELYNIEDGVFRKMCIAQKV